MSLYFQPLGRVSPVCSPSDSVGERISYASVSFSAIFDGLYCGMSRLSLSQNPVAAEFKAGTKLRSVSCTQTMHGRSQNWVNVWSEEEKRRARDSRKREDTIYQHKSALTTKDSSLGLLHDLAVARVLYD